MEVIILIVLFIVWMKYRSDAKKTIKELKLEDEYKKIKNNIKKNKSHSKLRTFVNIIVILTSMFLGYAITLWGINIFLTIISLGVFMLAGNGSRGRKMLDAAEFNGKIFGYVVYIFLYAIIIKNILFNIELNKFLKSYNFENDNENKKIDYNNN